MNANEKKSFISYQNEPCVLHEEEHLLLLFKPPSLHVVASGKEESTSLQSWLAKQKPEQKSLKESGIIQRLDYGSAGLLLAARDEETRVLLGKEIKEERVQKTYLIVTSGLFPKKQSFRSYLGSRYRGSKKVQVHSFSKPQPPRTLAAHTSFTRLAHRKQKLSFVRATAHAARRHQVRAHAAHLGYPLLGDTLYGSRTAWAESFSTPEADFFLLAESIYLHPEISSFVSRFKVLPPKEVADTFAISSPADL